MIVVVEDDENKRSDIIRAVRRAAPDQEIVEAKSLRSGIAALTASNPVLAIIDMSMPTFDISLREEGGRPQAFGGRELLRHVARRQLCTQIIVVTQFDQFGDGPSAVTLRQLDSELAEEHVGIYRGSIYYNSAISGWPGELSQLIRSVLKEGRR